MMDMATHFRKLGTALLATLFAGVSLTSCDDEIYNYEGDCTIRIKFKYDYNMKYADAFAHEVDAVNLYVFDSESGLLVETKQEAGSHLADKDYQMKLDMQPGEYDLLAWCGNGLTGGKFTLPAVTVGKTTREELLCQMERIQTEEHPACITEDINRLFHGSKHISFTVKELGVQVDTISLTKNTNVVRVILQHSVGEDVNPELFDIRITDDNGHYAADNSMLPDDSLTYHPWSVQGITADTDIDINTGHPYNTRASSTAVSAAMAEFTVGRLMADKNPILSVHNSQTGEKVFAIPLNEYALMVKGNYNRHMSDQEYLDRQDEYNMTFFLNHGKWVASRVIINSWHLVLHDDQEIK